MWDAKLADWCLHYVKVLMSQAYMSDVKKVALTGLQWDHYRVDAKDGLMDMHLAVSMVAWMAEKLASEKACT